MIRKSLPLLAALFALTFTHPAAGYEAPEDLYLYLATVSRVVDGNTLLADIDLGFGVWKHKAAIRLKGVDSPKPAGDTLESGAAAFKFLKEKLTGQERILLRTSWDPSGKFDGWLAIVSIWNDDKQAWEPVNQMVIDAGHGKPIEEK